MVESYLTILGLLFSLLQWGIMLFWQCHCENCRRKQVDIPAYYIHDSCSANHSYHFNFIIILQTTALWHIKVNAKQHDKLSCFWVYKHKPEQVSFGSGQSWQSDPRAIVSKSCPPITVPVTPTQTRICTNIKKKTFLEYFSQRNVTLDKTLLFSFPLLQTWYFSQKIYLTDLLSRSAETSVLIQTLLPCIIYFRKMRQRKRSKIQKLKFPMKNRS